MLTITRKVNQAIWIGRDVLVRVAIIRGNRVRLAFEAPLSTEIRRAELPERVTPEERAALIGDCIEGVLAPPPEDEHWDAPPVVIGRLDRRYLKPGHPDRGGAR